MCFNPTILDERDAVIELEVIQHDVKSMQCRIIDRNSQLLHHDGKIEIDSCENLRQKN